MSIVTKTGDGGQTALMYGLRVPKHHPRVEAYGAVDELNAALGLARALGAPPGLCTSLEQVQRDLILLMGELATDPEYQGRLARDGFVLLGPEHLDRLEREVKRIEQAIPVPKDWALPGANPVSAALDFARTVCRRAERRVCALAETPGAVRALLQVYLNRLSDLLWLWARSAELPMATASSEGVARGQDLSRFVSQEPKEPVAIGAAPQ